MQHLLRTLTPESAQSVRRLMALLIDSFEVVKISAELGLYRRNNRVWKRMALDGLRRSLKTFED